MSANLENSAGLEKVSFHSNPKERQCQRILKLPHNCIHLTAPHSSTLAWKIPWTEEPGRLQSTRSRRIGHDWTTSPSRTGEGTGNPLQCSCLENPGERGAWWAAVYGVAESQTRLKQLSSSSSNMLVKLCSKFSKPGFNSTWTMNFQMFKLDLEKAEEAEIKLPTSIGSNAGDPNLIPVSGRSLKKG